MLNGDSTFANGNSHHFTGCGVYDSAGRICTLPRLWQRMLPLKP